MNQRPFGFNVIGFISGNLGIGVAARNALRLLQERGVPFSIRDLNAGGGRSYHDTTFADHYHIGREEMPYGINLFLFNPPEITDLLKENPQWLNMRDRMN